METLQKEIKAHLFICCRQKEAKPCCAAKGAENLAQQLKAWTKERNIKDRVKVTQSSCLGHCESGITACLYPQNQWFHQIKETDLESLKKMLEEYAK